MAHKGETQSTSAEMPRIPFTIKRGGVYYFNARYPTHLVEAGAVAQTHCKKSLDTKDWREAKAKVARELAHFQYNIEQLQAESVSDGNGSRARVSLSSLSETKRRDIIFQWFVDRERDAEKFRAEFHESCDEFWKRERKEDAQVNLAHMEGFEGGIPL